LYEADKYFHIEQNGKTLHLLKSNAKPVKVGRKRRKVDVLGTFKDYQDSKKKPQMPLA